MISGLYEGSRGGRNNLFRMGWTEIGREQSWRDRCGMEGSCALKSFIGFGNTGVRRRVRPHSRCPMELGILPGEKGGGPSRIPGRRTDPSQRVRWDEDTPTPRGSHAKSGSQGSGPFRGRGSSRGPSTLREVCASGRSRSQRDTGPGSHLHQSDLKSESSQRV